jgi:hypothetical protein
MKGDTPRVQRVLKAFALLDSADAFVSDAKRFVLSSRIAAVLKQLTKDETAAYYAAIRRMRFPNG